MEQEIKPAYYCSKCHLGVIVLVGEPPIKACQCNAPIHVNMETTILGQSSTNV